MNVISVVAFIVSLALQAGGDNGSSDEENLEIHRFAMENGLWTPDPNDLVRLHKEGEDIPNPHGGVVSVEDTIPSSAKFITPNNTQVTVQVGNPATLRCTVADVSETETVSWIRRRDHHLITLGQQTYTSDGRFHLTHTPENHRWTLNLKYAQLRDTGLYECQLSTHPPMGIITSLRVIQPISVISGSPDLYAKDGGNVSLVCRLKNFTVPPPYVFWYHNDHMINYESDREISVVSRGGESILSINKIRRDDSGNYTCAPATAKSSWITLHIIPEEEPAAMQRASAPPPSRNVATLALLMLVAVTSL